MDYSMNTAGICTACIREYEILNNEDMPKGTVVTLKNGKVEKATDSDTVLGICSMDYKAEKDTLVPGSGSGRVKVTVSPGILCRMEHKAFTVTEAGTASTVKMNGISAPSDADAFAGGYVKLIYKPENSTNTDSVGGVRRITASSGTTLTLEEGGVPFAGDIYEILLPAGFGYLSLDGDARGFDISAAESQLAKIAVCLPESDFAEVCFTKTFFN